MPPERPLITVAQAAERMGIGKSKAHQLAAERKLPGLVEIPGHARMVRAAVLDAWLLGEDLPAPVRLRAVG